MVTALLVYALALRRGVQGYRLVLVGIGVDAMLPAANAYLLTRANLNDAATARCLAHRQPRRARLGPRDPGRCWPLVVLLPGAARLWPGRCG